MKKTKKSFGQLSLLIFLGGCVAKGPTDLQLSNADYGNHISPARCVEIAEAQIRGVLKDPYTAQFTHQPCYRGWGSSVPMLGFEVEFGYVQSGTVNAKNSFGGYTGSSIYNVLIKNGRVLRYCIEDDGICSPSRGS